MVGIGGLFGYHFFYFTALRNAPAVEASLIAYLWPLLIVVFSALLPGSERLGWHHIVGVLLGLGGCVLLVSDGGSVRFKDQYLLGYLSAAACALTWPELKRITPWGDSFEGFAPSGRTVEVERRYLWAVNPAGAIVVEVEVRDAVARTGAEARALLHAPG